MPIPFAAAGDRLSAQDAMFVYLEKKEMPLHIGCIWALDGPIPINRLSAWVEAKLPLIPRYRQRLAFPPLNIGHPTWEFDPDFDIRHHVQQARLKTGTDKELEAFAGQRLGAVMDRSRPLWDLTVVGGLAGNRCAIIARVHHCMVDGVAGIALMNVLLDTTPKIHPLLKKQPFHPPPLPDATTRLFNALGSAFEDFGNRILRAGAATLNVAKSVLSDLPRNSIDKLGRVLPELFAMVDRLPFNQPVKGPRRVAWTDFPLSEFKAIRVAAGVTLNDVCLALLATAVRHYSELHGQFMKNRVLHVMVPVNLHIDSTNPGVGNEVSILPVNIPLDVTEPLNLLKTVHNTTDTLKRLHIADLIALSGVFLGGIPAPVRAALFLLGNVLPYPPWNMVCTNVPGPQYPLYVLGRKVLTYYPYVPIGNDMGICCAIASYNGNIYFTFSGDGLISPDLGRMRDFLLDAYNELREAAGLARAEAPVHRVKPKLEKERKRAVRPPRKRGESVNANAAVAPKRRPGHSRTQRSLPSSTVD